MIKENDNIIFEGIYSHFSNSLASDNSFSNIQYERLINVIENIEKEGITFKYKHICNSSGFFKYKDKHLKCSKSRISIFWMRYRNKNRFKKNWIISYKTNKGKKY